MRIMVLLTFLEHMSFKGTTTRTQRDIEVILKKFYYKFFYNFEFSLKLRTWELY
jgi:predicted Zn-dependent peptidase